MDAPNPTQAQPLTYLSLLPVLKYMSMNKRSQLKMFCPEVRSVDKLVPYKLNEFNIKYLEEGNEFQVIVKEEYPKKKRSADNDESDVDSDSDESGDGSEERSEEGSDDGSDESSSDESEEGSEEESDGDSGDESEDEVAERSDNESEEESEEGWNAYANNLFAPNPIHFAWPLRGNADEHSDGRNEFRVIIEDMNAKKSKSEDDDKSDVDSDSEEESSEEFEEGAEEGPVEGSEGESGNAAEEGLLANNLFVPIRYVALPLRGNADEHPDEESPDGSEGESDEESDEQSEEESDEDSDQDADDDSNEDSDDDSDEDSDDESDDGSDEELQEILEAVNAVATRPRHIVWRITTEKIIKVWKDEQGRTAGKKSVMLVGSQMNVVNALVKHYLNRRGSIVEDMYLEVSPIIKLRFPIQVDWLRLHHTIGRSFVDEIQPEATTVDVYNKVIENTMVSAEQLVLTMCDSSENLHLLTPLNVLFIEVSSLNDEEVLRLLKIFAGQTRPHGFEAVASCALEEPNAAMHALINEPNSEWKASKYEEMEGYSLERNGNEVFIRQHHFNIEMHYFSWGYKRSTRIGQKSASSILQYLPLKRRQEMWEDGNEKVVQWIENHPIFIENLYIKCEEGGIVSAVFDGEQILDPFKSLSMFYFTNVFVENVHVEGHCCSSVFGNKLTVKNLKMESDLRYGADFLVLFNKEPLESLIVTSRTTVERLPSLANNAKEVIYMDESDFALSCFAMYF